MLYIVSVNDLVGAINRRGELVIDPKYDELQAFCDGLACFKYQGKAGFLNEKGEHVLNMEFEDAGAFSDGRAWIERRDRRGYIDERGKVVVPCKLYRANDFSFSLAVVWDDCALPPYFIDRHGRRVVEGNFDDADDYSEGFAGVQTGGKWGFIDVHGDWVIEPHFEYINPFKEGLAAVSITTGRSREPLFGFIDKTGQMVIEPRFHGAEVEFSEGLAPVWDGSFGFIDRKGELVIDYQFYDVDGFREGLCGAAVKRGRKAKYGFIDQRGNFVIPPIYDATWGPGFEGGLAQVQVKDRLGYIDYSGNWVWEPSS